MFGKKEVLFLFFVLLIVGVSSFVISSSSCADDDEDWVCDSVDLCPGSLKGERVDRDGCDPFQFCNQFYCGSECVYADFLDNEPQKEMPFDCTVVLVLDEGTYEPRCTPIECKKDLRISSGVFINISVTYGVNHYIDATLWNVPLGYDVYNGVWPGWCADKNGEPIQNKKRYDARLYSSYDPDLALKCPRCVNTNWTEINYLINHRIGTKEDVQSALWYFSGGGYPPPGRPNARAMVDEALLYGRDFWPQDGELMAIIIDFVEGIQLIFIEVDP